MAGSDAGDAGDAAAQLRLPAASRHQDARGGQTPEAKLERIAELRRNGQRVIMVGDGVNDAAAMAAATVGIAVRGGAEACLRAADVFATRGGLAPIEAVLRSRRTLAAIRRGTAISLTYNLLGIGLAVLGVLSPCWRRS